MRSVIHVERRRTAQGVSAPAELEAISARVPRSGTDPRRRFGSHAEARRFLAEHGRIASITPGVWDGLLNALRNHTIQDTLASLATWEREVLHLAFLEGRTNREIAAILSISRSTVRRRIVLGLATLDDQLRRAGTKASAVLLLVLASTLARTRLFARPFSALTQSPAANVVLTTVAGAAVGAVVVGVIVGNQAAVPRDHGPATSGTQVTAGAPLVVSAQVAPASTTGGGPFTLAHPTSAGAGAAVAQSSNAKATVDPGCDGNPTSAPPTTPVGPRDAHGQGLSPVTHPTAGGCGPHGTEGP
ncbi:MAG TPA: sigma-70 family RNA polymerase sigma factor [Candidatus Dormibacteraeota bacterium]|nr:sigma-70 family RNA polymerase sigma factor [Candidatus Dormibacteraeota bacterium]